MTLPQPLTELIGREEELSTLARLVMAEEARLVTVTGPGGCGKTRLVIEVGHRLAEHFADGVAFVGLTSHSIEAALCPWRTSP